MTEEIRVKCPWCHKGETYVDEDGSGAVTVQCSKCQHCYKVYLKDGSTTKVSARKRTASTTLKNQEGLHFQPNHNQSGSVYADSALLTARRG